MGILNTKQKEIHTHKYNLKNLSIFSSLYNECLKKDKNIIEQINLINQINDFEILNLIKYSIKWNVIEIIELIIENNSKEKELINFDKNKKYTLFKLCLNNDIKFYNLFESKNIWDNVIDTEICKYFESAIKKQNIIIVKSLIDKYSLKLKTFDVNYNILKLREYNNDNIDLLNILLDNFSDSIAYDNQFKYAIIEKNPEIAYLILCKYINTSKFIKSIVLNDSIFINLLTLSLQFKNKKCIDLLINKNIANIKFEIDKIYGCNNIDLDSFEMLLKNNFISLSSTLNMIITCELVIKFNDLNLFKLFIIKILEYKKYTSIDKLFKDDNMILLNKILDYCILYNSIDIFEHISKIYYISYDHMDKLFVYACKQNNLTILKKFIDNNYFIEPNLWEKLIKYSLLNRNFEALTITSTHYSNNTIDLFVFSNLIEESINKIITNKNNTKNILIYSYINNRFDIIDKILSITGDNIINYEILNKCIKYNCDISTINKIINKIENFNLENLSFSLKVFKNTDLLKFLLENYKLKDIYNIFNLKNRFYHKYSLFELFFQEKNIYICDLVINKIFSENLLEKYHIIKYLNDLIIKDENDRIFMIRLLDNLQIEYFKSNFVELTGIFLNKLSTIIPIFNKCKKHSFKIENIKLENYTKFNRLSIKEIKMLIKKDMIDFNNRFIIKFMLKKIFEEDFNDFKRNENKGYCVNVGEKNCQINVGQGADQIDDENKHNQINVENKGNQINVENQITSQIDDENKTIQKDYSFQNNDSINLLELILQKIEINIILKKAIKSKKIGIIEYIFNKIVWDETNIYNFLSLAIKNRNVEFIKLFNENLISKDPNLDSSLLNQLMDIINKFNILEN